MANHVYYLPLGCKHIYTYVLPNDILQLLLMFIQYEQKVIYVSAIPCCITAGNVLACLKHLAIRSVLCFPIFKIK